MLVVLCLAAIHGSIYLLLVPPWGHYDEPTHLEYGWLIANRLELPRPGDVDPAMRREVANSMLETGFYRDLDFEPQLLPQDEPIHIGLSELRHPPLYYLLIAVPLRLFRHTDVAFQLTLGRLVSLLLYLASIAIAYGLIAEVVPLGHPLRWTVPAVMALLPGYADLMTAVNNDVGAVVAMSLFLWGAVRAIVRGPSLFHMAWVALAALLCVYTKNTASIAVILVPLVLALALVRRPIGWWIWIGLLAGGLVLTVFLFSWGDGALWDRFTSQAAPTSQDVAHAPLGSRALALEPEFGGQAAQILLREDVDALQGVTVTLGAWIWATQPAQVRTPALDDGLRHTGRTVQVGLAPVFYTVTATVSTNAETIQVRLNPVPGEAEPGLVVYYDGIVLAKGEWPQDRSPRFEDPQGRTGTWGGQAFMNRVRNGSAESTWPYLRPWVSRLLERYSHRSPAQFLASILDWERTKWGYSYSAASLLQTFWARFGWGQVALPVGWYWVLGAVTALAGAGVIIWGVRLRRSGQPAGMSMGVRRAIGLLGLAGLLVWANALLRFQPLRGTPFIPGARYAYPAIIPTVLALASGWLALVPARSQRARFWRWGAVAMFCALWVLDVMAIRTVYTFYYGG